MKDEAVGGHAIMYGVDDAAVERNAWDNWEPRLRSTRLIDHHDALQQYAEMDAKMTRKMWEALCEKALTVDRVGVDWNVISPMIRVPKEYQNKLEPGEIIIPESALDRAKVTIPRVFRKTPTLTPTADYRLGACPVCHFVGVVGEECPVCRGSCSTCQRHPCGHELRWAARNIIGAWPGIAAERIFNVMRSDGVVCRISPWVNWKGERVLATRCDMDVDFNESGPLPDWTLQDITCLACEALT